MEGRHVITVLGPGAATADEESLARRVGALAAAAGWVVLTGGGPGVMAAACRGAREAGGSTVGVLPSAGPCPGYPNEWVEIPVYTGFGIARNAINILSATLAVAIGGGAGTLSEIAMAVKSGVECWCVRSWRLQPPPGGSPLRVVSYDEPDEFLIALSKRLAELSAGG